MVERRVRHLVRGSRERAWTQTEIDDAWRGYEARLVGVGATANEAREIVRVVRESIAARKISGHPIYAVPAYAREGRVAARKVWVVGYGWGLSSPLGPGGFREPPGHHCVLVIDALPPYKVLTTVSCL